MTASIGSIFVIAALAMIPFSFLFAGKDTNHRHPSGRERQREAMLDWTDKDLIAEEQDRQKRTCRTEAKNPGGVRIETVVRESLSPFAA